MIVAEEYPHPGVKLDYYGGTAGTYAGFDRFGRVVDQRWVTTGQNPVDRDRFKYAYDYASNRTWRQNAVAGDSRRKDELYAHDGLAWLGTFKRGKLNAGKTEIPTTDNDRVKGQACGE
jgi:hypothetical protein